MYMNVYVFIHSYIHIDSLYLHNAIIYIYIWLYVILSTNIMRSRRSRTRSVTARVGGRA